MVMQSECKTVTSDQPLDPELRELRERRLKALMAAPVPKAAPAKPVEVTDGTLQALLAEHRIVVVDAWAAWCGPCRMIAPILEDLAREFAGRVVVAKLDVDRNPETPMRFGVQGIPTLLVFKDGQLVDRVVGYVPKPQLAARFARYAEG